MRTLNRPMFNMGGPIKQGIMHGIREPHQLGQIAGRIAPFASKVFGRVRGLLGKTAPKNVEIGQQIKRLPPTGGYSKGYPGPKTPGGWERGPMITETQNIFTPKPWAAATGKYLKGSPEAALLTGAWKGKGFLGKPLKMAAKSPLIMAGLVYSGGKWLWPDGTEASTDEIAKITEGQHGPFDHTDKKKIKKAQAAFAEAQRDTRVQKYLDIMGYDRSKKTAVADALIDASKIVSERGSLKGDVTRELINPIIQATSKRFDKPEQIREAVGLMTVKAAIEKDLTKEKDALTTKLTKLKIEGAEIALASSASFEGGLEEFLTSRKGKVGKNELTQMARLLANKHGDSFTVIEDITAIPEGGSGIYMSGSDIYRVIDGNAQQLA